MIKIEEYSDKYKKDVTELVLHIENDENKLGLTLEEQPDLSDINTYFKNGKFWIALEDDILIGTLAIVKKSDTVAVMKKFFVRKDMRGTGIAKKLYDICILYAKENHIEQIILDTPSVAKPAHRFYEREGFKRITYEAIPVSYSYPDRDCYLYLLKL